MCTALIVTRLDAVEVRGDVETRGPSLTTTEHSAPFEALLQRFAKAFELRGGHRLQTGA